MVQKIVIVSQDPILDVRCAASSGERMATSVAAFVSSLLYSSVEVERILLVCCCNRILLQYLTPI
jgi:hypothetical protein